MIDILGHKQRHRHRTGMTVEEECIDQESVDCDAGGMGDDGLVDNIDNIETVDT